MKDIIPRKLVWLLCSFLASNFDNVFAQNETRTIPVGYITVNITQGTGSSRANTVISFPLKERANIQGAAVGRLTGVTANTLSNSAAGWAAGALSQPQNPYLIRITSGAANGLTLLISSQVANTSNTVSVAWDSGSPVNLTTLGIQTGANGDTYEIVTCDTVLGVFGTPSTTGILGGSNPNAADHVVVMTGGVFRKFYYNTTVSKWRTVGTEIDVDTFPLHPDYAAIYSRLGATPISLIIMGEVPSGDRRAVVPASGNFLMARSWPTDGTLASSGIANIPNWRKSTDQSQVDFVAIMNGGVWTRYYHDGTNWRTLNTANTISNNVVIPAGAGVMLGRLPAISQIGQILMEAMPYSL